MEAESIFGEEASALALSFPLWYSDYGGTAHVDFRSRRCGGRAFVFVFFYSDYQAHEDVVAAMLASFSGK